MGAGMIHILIDSELYLRRSFPNIHFSRLDRDRLPIGLLTLLHPVAVPFELGGLLLEQGCLSGDFMRLTPHVLIIVRRLVHSLLPRDELRDLGWA